MAFMIWTDKMSVGVASVDAEHQRLVEMIDELYEGVLADAAEPALNSVLDGLIEYTDVHFRNEEQLFEKAHYSRLAQHKAQHDELRRRVGQYREQVGNQKSTIVAAELLRFLKEWLAQHIQHDDKEACAFLKSKGIE